PRRLGTRLGKLPRALAAPASQSSLPGADEGIPAQGGNGAGGARSRPEDAPAEAGERGGVVLPPGAAAAPAGEKRGGGKALEEPHRGLRSDAVRTAVGAPRGKGAERTDETRALRRRALAAGARGTPARPRAARRGQDAGSRRDREEPPRAL